jgi:PiT family inorganic phosphate transporter
MDATLALPLLVTLIVVALLFDFINGLHDAANSIATIVSTRVLRPQYAVFWAAFFNFIVLSPFTGFLLAIILILIVSWAFIRATPFAVDSTFRTFQFVSAALYSLGHGGNDAQKTMGIIAVLLYSQGLLGNQFHVPFWVVLTCQAAMGLGTLFGGWRIVHTMGSKITRLTPMQGFCAETGGAVTLFMATSLGIPVSTTHTITGAIVGVGAARRISAVRWNVASNIVVAWIVTLPASALIGAAGFALATVFG